jgi:predicted ATP-dependent Lon-type protease
VRAKFDELHANYLPGWEQLRDLRTYIRPSIFGSRAGLVGTLVLAEIALLRGLRA